MLRLHKRQPGSLERAAGTWASRQCELQPLLQPRRPPPIASLGSRRGLVDGCRAHRSDDDRDCMHGSRRCGCRLPRSTPAGPWRTALEIRAPPGVHRAGITFSGPQAHADKLLGNARRSEYTAAARAARDRVSRAEKEVVHVLVCKSVLMGFREILPAA